MGRMEDHERHCESYTTLVNSSGKDVQTYRRDRFFLSFRLLKVHTEPEGANANNEKMRSGELRTGTDIILVVLTLTCTVPVP